MHIFRLSLLGTLAVSIAVLVTAGAGTAGGSKIGFGTPVYVDQSLAGGEPEAIMDTLHGKFVYTSHEGTTHLYRDGYTMSPWGDFSFVSNYCNQVNVWNSSDGINWFSARYLGSQCPQNPLQNTGLRPRPDVRRGRQALQHRHRPRERRALLVAGRRHHLGSRHPLLPQRRPAVAGGRRARPGLHEHRLARRAR